MGKKRSRSLASRKKAKDMSMATEEHVFKHDMKRAEPPKASWETALPRKLRAIMHWQQVERGEKPKPRPREDKPRPIKQPVAVGASESLSKRGPYAGAPAVEQKKRKRTNDQSEAQQVQLQQHPAQQPPWRPKEGKSKPAVSKPRFGETNDQPPELVLIGQLAKNIRRGKGVAQ